ncbi:hypothetical protein JYT20_00150 [Rhodothermus sp. AH-315-K08]|nr:hypothetical protein [Rhodothermus sp. AH-315-K08]
MTIASEIVRFRDGTCLSAFLKAESIPDRPPFILSLSVHAAETDIVLARVERIFIADDEAQALDRFEPLRARVKGLEHLLWPPAALFDRI